MLGGFCLFGIFGIFVGFVVGGASFGFIRTVGRSAGLAVGNGKNVGRFVGLAVGKNVGGFVGLTVGKNVCPFDGTSRFDSSTLPTPK